MKLLLTLCCVLLILSAQAQNVWIVDNRPSAPTGAHIFTNINDAVAAATSGDIIHVIPSSTDYPISLISKNGLTIYGIGFNPDKEIATRSRVLDMTIATGVSDTRISGLYFVDNDVNITIGDGAGAIANIFIENCLLNGQITATTVGADKDIDNVVIRNCVVGQNMSTNDYVIDLTTEANANNVLITNNVIMGYSFGATASLSVRNAIVRNNLFLGDDSNDLAFHILTTSTVSNNIFYGRAPRLDINSGNFASNSTLLNNISAGNTDNSFVTGAGIVVDGSNFPGNSDLTMGFAIQDTWDFSFDPTPSGADAINGGNDGTDIGLTGSTIPFSTTGSPLPVIKTLRLPEIIQEGTDVDATIEAEGN